MKKYIALIPFSTEARDILVINGDYVYAQESGKKFMKLYNSKTREYIGYISTDQFKKYLK